MKAYEIGRRLEFRRVLFRCGVVKAQAATSDTMNVLVTPGNPTYGVQITSGTAGGYNFGSVNLGGTTGSTAAVGVKNSRSEERRVGKEDRPGLAPLRYRKTD